MKVYLDDSDLSEILRYLGYRGGELDEKTKDDISECIRIINDCADVRMVCVLGCVFFYIMCSDLS